MATEIFKFTDVKEDVKILLDMTIYVCETGVASKDSVTDCDHQWSSLSGAHCFDAYYSRQ